MNLYIKQKVFSWKDRFSVFDENQNICFTAESEFFSLGKKLHLYDSMHREAAFIRQKLLSFLPKYSFMTSFAFSTAAENPRYVWVFVCASFLS